MKFWDRIKDYFYKRALKEAMLHSKVKRHITNLNDAKSIGIIYNSTNAANDTIIKKFAEQLRGQGKAVDILGFVNDSKIESKPDITIFNKKKLSWVGMPDDGQVNKFTAKHFDLLLACFTGHVPALEYIAATSHAKWRLGVYSTGKTEYYDMMVNLGDKNDLQYLLDQAVHFLNEIKYN